MVVYHLKYSFASPFFFCLMILRPPRSTLFLYTTLFRSSGSRAVPHPTSSMERGGAARYRVNRRRHIAGVSSFGSGYASDVRSEEHTSELQSLRHLVCRLLLEKKHKKQIIQPQENKYTQS